jgi:hypothetical protein
MLQKKLIVAFYLLVKNFVLRELELFQNYFFYERLELWDWQLDGRIFFMPRFVRNLSENGKEILSMKVSDLVWLVLVWWDWQLDGRIFFMPRFVRNLSENGK